MMFSTGLKSKIKENPAYRSLNSQTEIEKRDLKILKERLEKDLDFLERN